MIKQGFTHLFATKVQAAKTKKLAPWPACQAINPYLLLCEANSVAACLKHRFFYSG